MNKMTKHASIDRFDRISFIIDTVGCGQPLCSTITTDHGDKRKLTLTTTGIIIIQSMDGTVITMYFGNVAKGAFIYREATGRDRLPHGLHETLIQCEKLSAQFKKIEAKKMQKVA